MALKTCFKCGESKPRDAFYGHPRMADGLLGKCKACTKRDTRERRKARDPAELAAYERARQARPERRAQQAATTAKMRALYPEKYRARNIVNGRVFRGSLVPEPCRRCGSTNRVQAHHPDYSAPLDVEWLCEPCHREHHDDGLARVESGALV